MRAAVLMGLVACTSKPAPTVCSSTGETCSPLAPYGIDIDSPAIHHDLPVNARLALGGTAQFTLFVRGKPESGEINVSPLDAPYVATIDDADIALTTSGNVVTLRSLANTGDRAPGGGTLEIRDTDGRPLGQRDIQTSAIDQIDSIIATGEQYSGYESVPIFAPGSPVNIGLWDAGNPPIGDNPLWDDSMTVTGALQVAWDLIAAPAVTSVVTVSAADHSPVDVTINVATDVTITQFIGDPSVSASQPANLCFEARSGGHLVFGATWTYTVNGAAPLAPDVHVNCIRVTADPTVTNMTIVVSAAGASLTVTLPVI